MCTHNYISLYRVATSIIFYTYYQLHNFPLCAKILSHYVHIILIYCRKSFKQTEKTGKVEECSTFGKAKSLNISCSGSHFNHRYHHPVGSHFNHRYHHPVGPRAHWKCLAYWHLMNSTCMPRLRYTISSIIKLLLL